jgi:uncharacterized protein DUF5615
MSRLFIELYLDEDVDVLIAQLIRARGFVVVTTQEAGQLRNNDAEQLAYAVRQHKTLLTTLAWSRRPTAYAPLQLPGAAEAQR